MSASLVIARHRDLTFQFYFLNVLQSGYLVKCDRSIPNGVRSLAEFPTRASTEVAASEPRVVATRRTQHPRFARAVNLHSAEFVRKPMQLGDEVCRRYNSRIGTIHRLATYAFPAENLATNETCWQREYFVPSTQY